MAAFNELKHLHTGSPSGTSVRSSQELWYVQDRKTQEECYDLAGLKIAKRVFPRAPLPYDADAFVLWAKANRNSIHHMYLPGKEKEMWASLSTSTQEEFIKRAADNRLYLKS